MKANVVIIDIDGVLADYRMGLLCWMRHHFPELHDTCNEHIVRTDTWLNADTMGVSFRHWLDILEKFRMSGGKLTLPAYPGASELTHHLAGQGHRIVLLTSRPVDVYSTIYNDTIRWLAKNNITHHLLLWSKNKSDVVYKMRLVDECLFAVDDEMSHVVDYAKLAIPTYWIDHYDKDVDFVSPFVTRVGSVKEILERRIKE